MALAVMVVGGEPSLIQHTYKKKLAVSGVDVHWHVDRVRQVDTLPPDCQGVIIIKDMCTHGLRDSAVSLAKERGVPFANVSRKFSKAEPILRSVGILKPAATMSPPNVPHTDRIDVAVHYIENERQRGRVPKKDEVESVIQRAFGPRVKLTIDNYKKAASLAAQVVPFPVEVKEDMKTNTAVPVEDYCALLFEDEPSLVLSAARTVAKIEDLFSGDRSHLPTSKCLFDMALDKADEKKKEWKTISRSRTRHNPQREVVNRLKRRWLQNLFEEAQKTGSYPNTVAIKEQSKLIFGGSIQWDLVREVRSEVTGEPLAPRTVSTVSPEKKKSKMQKNLIKTPKAYTFYRSLCDVANVPPVGEKRFRKLLGTVIQATRAGGRDDQWAPWETTRDSVKRAYDASNGDFAKHFRGNDLEAGWDTSVESKTEIPKTPKRVSQLTTKAPDSTSMTAVLDMMQANAAASVSAINKLTETLTTFMAKMDARTRSVENDARTVRTEMAELADNLNEVVSRLSNRSPERKTINLTDLLESGVEVSLSTKSAEG
jgi:hypothetical protein